VKVKDQPKYLAIAEDLRLAVEEQKLAVGGALPSHSELVDKYGASVSTIRQAISYMARQGWVKARQGRGVFVQRPAAAPARSADSTTVGFAVFDASLSIAGAKCPWHVSDAVNALVYQGAAEVLQRNKREAFYGVFGPGPDSLERFGAFLGRVSSVLVFESFDQRVLDVLQEHPHVRPVLLGHPVDDICVDGYSCASVDLSNAGYLAAQALGIHNHKKVAFVGQLAGRPNAEMTAGFERACRQYGLQCRVNLSILDMNEHQVAKHLADDPECTGVVIVGDLAAGRIQQSLAGLGVQTPRDKSIVAIGGIPSCYTLSARSMARVNCLFEELGRQGARLLFSAAMNTRSRVTPVMFERGDSLRMV
jgi:DNA-binding LacI/PurR family transcriptional regulator